MNYEEEITKVKTKQRRLNYLCSAVFLIIIVVGAIPPPASILLSALALLALILTHLHLSLTYESDTNALLRKQYKTGDQ